MHWPDVPAAELQQAGFRGGAPPGHGGAGPDTADVDEWLDDDDGREVLMRAIRRLEDGPAALGAFSHLLGLGRAVSR
jgi:hypothetical protein